MLLSSEWHELILLWNSQHFLHVECRECAETRQRLVQLSDVLSCVKAEALGAWRV